MTEIRRKELFLELDKLLLDAYPYSPDWADAFVRIVKEFEADGYYFILPGELWRLVLGGRVLEEVRKLNSIRPCVSSADWDAAIASCVKETEKKERKKKK